MNYSEMAHNPLAERIVEVLKKKTGNINDVLFFRVMTAFYLSKVASMMRCSVMKYDKQVIPVNMYALGLLPSGFGKGHSTNILETNIIGEFRDHFLQESYPIIATQNVTRIAQKRAIKKGTDEAEELEQTGKEFESLGQIMFSFDSGTPAALKQMRLKLLMANAGSMNMHIDEIGSNLIANQDMLDVFLETFDVGKVKQKLIKNTAENVRLEDMEGITPANLVMFGTPVKLLDGGRVEDLFNTFLETGYGRRCFFGYVDPIGTKHAGRELTAEEIYDNLLNSTVDTDIEQISGEFADLADIQNFHKILKMDRQVSICVIAYQMDCKVRAAELPPHDEVGQAELIHRYFKVLKLAGAYAFCEGKTAVEQTHLEAAIKLAEESGEAFKRILSRDKNHIRLAKYISTCGQELTQSDLVEALPFYKGTNAAKNEMMTLAIAWGYKNNIIIRKTYSDGIEFISGDAIVETNCDQLILSHSQDAAFRYVAEQAPFDRLHELTQIPNHHWATHHFKAEHRDLGSVIKGFNMVVLDIDHGCTIDTAKLLLKDYKYHLYTTKSHTEGAHRFRVVMPISHILKLGVLEYKEFMANLFEWIPFECDEATGQAACKWASNPGYHCYNDGVLLDALQFIPATTKSIACKKTLSELTNLDNLERWFALRMVPNQRSNEMVRYALMLVDSGMPIEDVEERVLALNSKLKDSLPEEELGATVLRTASKRYLQRQRKVD